MPWKISRTFYDDDFPDASLNDKITIFEDRVMGWQLEIAEQLADRVKHSGFAVLSILVSYFEMIAKFRDGYCQDTRSSDYFKKGMRWVFPQEQFTDAQLKLTYRELRSGLYHASITGPRVILSRDFVRPICCTEISGRTMLEVNPHSLPRALQEHFASYIRDLRDPDQLTLRQQFQQRFDHQGSPFRKSSQFSGGIP